MSHSPLFLVCFLSISVVCAKHALRVRQTSTKRELVVAHSIDCVLSVVAPAELEPT